MLDSLGLDGMAGRARSAIRSMEKILTNFALVFFFMMAAMGCQESGQVSERVWSERVQLKKTHALGLNPGDWVTRPSEVTETVDGTILVSDHGRMQILRFDSEGHLIGRVGGRGRETGKFLHISSFAADTSGSIVVFDNILARSTIFDKQGLVMRTDSLDRHNILWPRQLLGTVDTLLAVYKLPDQDNQGVRRAQSPFLMHSLVLTPEGYKIDLGFGRVKSMADVRLHAVERFMQLKPGYVVSLSKNIWYAPPLADGRLFRFNLDESGTGVPTRGWVEPSRSYEIPTELPTDSTKKSMIIFTVSKNRRSGIILLRESLGIYTIEQKYLIHFYLDRSVDLDRPIFVVDIYNDEGEYQFSGNLTRYVDFEKINFGISPLRIHYLSPSGSLYVSGLLGSDTISVFQFDVQLGDGPSDTKKY